MSLRLPIAIAHAPPAVASGAAYDVELHNVLCGEVPLELEFQPIADLVQGVAAGYQTVVHLPDALGKSTSDCLRRAACLGKRLELEQEIIRTALSSRELLPPNCFLVVSVSAPFLVSTHWERLLSKVEDLSKIVIEVTQEDPITNYDLVRSNLCLIRSMGGSIAVSDAGSGYASLHHSLQMKPNFIKLGSALVSDCDSDPTKSVLIEMIGRAANRMDAWIIADGVQTSGELRELTNLEVPLAQGSYLADPQPSMDALPAERSAEIVSQTCAMVPSNGLTAHIEICPTATTQFGARHLLTSSTASIVVVLDPWKRPHHMLERHPLLGLRGIPDLMTVQLHTEPSEILHRALTRSSATRFDPLAVIDPQGVFQGFVRVDRLTRRLLASNTTSTSAAVRQINVTHR
jgi:EAL domain-containing protein (putative c-di-GMP-specific phosphodiesterase class I)